MIMVQWSCEIPPEKLEDFVKFAKEKLKPFHESHGCKRVELFMPMEVQKKYFPYQTIHKRNRYIEQLIFDDLKAFEDFLDAVKKDPQAEEIIGRYGREFNVSSCSFTVLAQTV
ncbi:MAG: hypothetical protein OEY24_02740 [Candidatus Bathyarchaeota archaeon]|nr:hypothetical protein [Candidatus Bathyarchaeota archaeon]